MAKLNVKVVDMVNGEITKVAYEGAEYTAIETFGEAKKGDLLYSENYDSPYVSKESFYEIIGNTGGSVRFIDNCRENGYNVEATVVKAFRKISESKPTLEQRVESLESDVASLKGESSEGPKRLTVGDIAKVVGDTSLAKAEIGDVVKIVEDEHDRQPYRCERILDGKDVGWFFPRDLEAYVEETIEFEGSTYRKVEREAREGDVIISTVEHSFMVNVGKPYKVGDGGCVIAEDDCTPSVYNAGRNLKNVDVYALIEQAKHVPQEGDIVVIVKSENGSRNSVGDIGKVSNVSHVNFAVDVPQKPKAPRVNGNKHEAYEVRKATPAEVEQYEQAVHKASFAVGDYVKVTDDFCDKVVNVGDICEIVHDDGTNLPFKLKRLTDGKVSGFMYARGLVKATDAEIAKATAPKLKAGDFVKFKRSIGDTTAGKPYLIEVYPSDEELSFKDDAGDFCDIDFTGEYEILSAEEAKWAKIGRMPNEFKKGDVVRVTTKNFEHNVGDIRIISQCNVGAGFDFALVDGGYIDAKNIELVAPAESKFNA